ncbi:uncharacterized protein LOC128179813 [Crassostrea angulata]|uniref:uncharacterized protein LOC128179813 n=1 Tax=Magallana angulata TaxID=2784310 RepID=UPI0022B0FC50|nr:uncharacterized protein LOC128179813 [Crassostrea angulata]
MAGNSSTFRVDLLLHSLKEIQQEKNCLEHKLAERRSRRRELENLLDIENNKFTQMKEGHEKLQETMKVAQLKETQTQSMANRLEESNQQKRKNIDELNRKLSAEKEKQLQNVENFEKELADIANQLMNARTFYDDSSLNKGISETEFYKSELQNKVENCQQEHFDLQQRLQTLSINDRITDLPDIPMELRKEIWALFKDENTDAKDLLKRKKESLQQISQKLTTLKA